MRQLVAIALLVPALAVAAPSRALPPEDQRYEYPSEEVEESPYPVGVWRYPAVAVDALLVRPVMFAGLLGGAALFVVTLPFSAPTRTTDDAVAALTDQAESTFRRPLGEF